MLSGGLERAAAAFGDRAAIRAGDRSWTFAELAAWTDGFAAAVPPGERVAVCLTNRVEFLPAVLGIAKTGGSAVLLSPAWKAAEVAHALAVTGATWGVVEEATAGVFADPPSTGGTGAPASFLPPVRGLTDVESVAPGAAGGVAAAGGSSGAPASVGGALPAGGPAGASASVGGALPAGGPASDSAPVLPPERDLSADAVLVFSSGTTGLPKAVRHTHASLGAATRHWVDALGLGPDDRFQVATPPSHILGLLNLLAAAEAGACVRLHARFDLDEVLAAIEADRITLEMAVAPIALAMANHPRLEDHDLSSLRYIMWGATPVTESVAETVTARTGVRWLPAYGASELPVLAVNPVDQPDRWRLDSAGLPPASVELRVVSLETGEVLPPGEVGELQARSPSVMAGYLPAEADAEAFVDGWYRTGDIGWLEPEGWVHLTDRSKEMIKVKGFQVAPAELEAVLHGHPAVLDCAVFGIPDELAGEVPVAAVQLDPAASVTPEELRQLVADTLATYKQLREVVLVDKIPRLPSGKVLRRVLRDQWLGATA